MTTRLDWPHDWRSRLIRFLEARERSAFAWGVRDCFLMAADAHVAMRGIDPAAEWRGRYKTETGAARLMRRNGCADMRDVARLLFSEIDLVDALDGSIGLVEQDGRWGMGVFCGPYFYVQAERGLGILPRTAAGLAFEVQ